MADRSAGDDAGKPRPAVIVQADGYDELDSLLVCPMTSVDEQSRVLRVPVLPSAELRLETPSWIMVERLTAIRRTRARPAIGRLHPSEMTALERSLAVVLGFG